MTSQTRDKGRLAFPAMLVGSASLAFGPWMVRLADVPPLASGFWRLALATPILLLLCTMGRPPMPRLDKRLLILLGIAGVAFGADLAVWHEGIVRTTLANSVLVGNAASFMFAAWGFIVARRPPDRLAALALAFAVAGMLLLMGHSYELSPTHLAGDILCLLAAVFYTTYLIAVGSARGQVAPLPTIALATAAGAATLFIVALATETRLWPNDWTPLVILALSSQVFGQGLVVYAVAYLEPLVAGLCLLIQPVIAATIGWITYGEKVGTFEIIGALFVAAALVLVRLPRSSGSIQGRDGLDTPRH